MTSLHWGSQRALGLQEPCKEEDKTEIKEEFEKGEFGEPTIQFYNKITANKEETAS